MWHDNETLNDLLGFNRYTAVIADLVTDPRVLPVTVGIFGDWGSGKSSQMSMLRSNLSGRQDVCCLSFNGWLFEGYDDAKSALISAVLTELDRAKGITEKGKLLVGSLLKRVDWFRTVGLAARHVITLTPPSLGELDGLLRPEADEGNGQRSILEFRQDFEALVKETGLSAVVVLIDDVDRCLPDRIIETLEAIKLFLAVPRTAFVIGADERIVRHAVSARYQMGPDTRYDITRDYLEKLIQIPFRIPPLSDVEVESYVNLLFCELALSAEDFAGLCAGCSQLRVESPVVAVNYGAIRDLLGSVGEELSERLALSASMSPILCSGTRGNPRQIKRFLNTLMLRKRLADVTGLSITVPVLAKLMALEYFHEAAFQQLHRWQLVDGGVPKALQALETATKPGASGKISVPDDGASSWVESPEVTKWLRTEPLLGGMDLAQYFHLTREKIGGGSSGGRLASARVQEVYAMLRSESDSERQQGLKRLEGLSQEDRLSLVQLLASRIMHDPSDRALVSLIMVCERWPDGLGSLTGALRGVPPASVPAGIVPRLATLAKTDTYLPQILDLLQTWAESPASSLQKAAQKYVAKLPGGHDGNK